MAEEGVLVSKELAEIMREMARKYKAHGWPTQSANQPRFYPEDSIIFVNRSGEEIPAYACMQITGTIEEDGRTLLEVDKPSAVDNESVLLLNGPREVADNETGSAQSGAIVKAFKDATETENTPGGGWGYTEGEWYLSPGGSFIYFGLSEIDDDVIVVRSPSGGGTKYFILAEDANVSGRGYVYAFSATINQTTGDIENPGATPFKLWNWQQILTSPTYAKAGYSGICSSNNIFQNGPCIGGCQADGTIAVDAIPAGEVGTAYSHTVTGSTIDDTTIDVTGLPDGLTFDGETNEISGAPTTAGTTLVTVTATSDNACPITKIVEFVVTEAP